MSDMVLQCIVCSKDFSPINRTSWARYCSEKCRTQARFGPKIGERGTGIPPGTVGAIGEMKACVDLMLKGFEVFRAVSPSSSCDLVIFKGQKILTVEVRTGYKDLISGKIVTQRKHSAQLLAISTKDGMIYEPPFPVPGDVT